MMRGRLIFIICIFSLAAPGVFAASSLQQAETLFAQKQYGQSRSEFLPIVADDPRTSASALARFRAAECLFSMKDYTAFKAEIETIQREHPPTDLYQRNGLEYYLARIPYESGKFRESAESLGLVALRHPTSVWGAKAGFLQGSALRKLKKYDEARRAFLAVAKAGRKPEWILEARHRAAQCQFDGGQIDEFRKEAQSLMAEHPSIFNKWVQMTELLLAQTSGGKDRLYLSANAIEQFIVRHPGFFQMDLALHRCGRLHMEAAAQDVRKGLDSRSRMFAQIGQKYLRDLCAKYKAQSAQDPAKASDYRTRFWIMENYYIARDYAKVIEEARLLGSQFSPPTRLWAAGKLWEGIGLANTTPPDYGRANAAFDAILAANVLDEGPHEHLPTSAAYWRAWLAKLQGDPEAFKIAMLRLIQMPESPSKMRALNALSPKTK